VVWAEDRSGCAHMKAKKKRRRKEREREWAGEKTTLPMRSAASCGEAERSEASRGGAKQREAEKGNSAGMAARARVAEPCAWMGRRGRRTPSPEVKEMRMEDRNGRCRCGELEVGEANATDGRMGESAATTSTSLTASVEHRIGA